MHYPKGPFTLTSFVTKFGTTATLVILALVSFGNAITNRIVSSYCRNRKGTKACTPIVDVVPNFATKLVSVNAAQVKSLKVK